jgi:CubicO group peptidase (beta-lactamase class C family)
LDGRKVTPADVARTVERLMAASRVPGLALAILNRGEIVYLQGFGYRDGEQHTPLTDSTIMYTASFTKAMFAYLVMQLVQEGTLDLDKPVYQYLDQPLPQNPTYVNSAVEARHRVYADSASERRYQHITARMLLSHTSGLSGPEDPQGELVIKFEPGTNYSYSNAGFNHLQQVIEHITGRSVGDMMRERVFSRLGMTRTSMVWDSTFDRDYAIGNDGQGQRLPRVKPTSPSAAASVQSDMTDVVRFVQAVLRGDGLSRKARDEMLSPKFRIHSMYQWPDSAAEDSTTSRDDPIRLAAGLGWGLLLSPYGKAYFNGGGGGGGFRNYMILFEKPKTAMVIMSNSQNGYKIFADLLAILISDRFTPAVWLGYVR